MRLHVQQVIGALAQPRILERLESRDGAADRDAPCESGALPRGDGFACSVAQLRIIKKLQMRSDDFSARTGAGRCYALEPNAHVGQRFFEDGEGLHWTRAVLSDRDLAPFDS